MWQAGRPESANQKVRLVLGKFQQSFLGSKRRSPREPHKFLNPLFTLFSWKTSSKKETLLSSFAINYTNISFIQRFNHSEYPTI